MTRITEDQWVDYYHFVRFPFDRPEAGNEEFARPDFLASCFVKPEKFDRLMGQADNPVSGFLFAARGSGKTACRVMIDYYCKAGDIPSKRHQDKQNSFVLSVPHIYLDNVVDISRGEDGKIHNLAKNHAVEILRRAVPAFAELIAKMPEGFENVQKLSDTDKKDLGWLIANYSNYLSSTQANYIQSVGLDVFAQGETAIGFPYLSKLTKISHQSSLAEYHQSKQAKNFPLDHLREWAYLVHNLGIGSTYVLVDGADELEETASDPEFAYRLLRPLITNLRFMDGIPYLAMKFFLPDFIREGLLSDSKFRKDRNFIIETIQWTDQQLLAILQKRLSTLKPQEQRLAGETGENDMSEDNKVSFSSLCTPALRSEIEVDLVKNSQGNPRSLFVLCGMMVSAHCNREILDQDDPYELNKEDFNLALDAFDRYFALQIIDIKSSLDIQKMIEHGETDQVEFKSSIRWDTNKNQVNKDLQFVIAKTIAGMLNQNGGVLLIGVKDDGLIFGIQPDMETLNSKNKDGFYRAIMDIVKIYIDIASVALSSISIQFYQIENKEICAVLMRNAPEPVYVKFGETTEFWVRMGNATNRLGTREAVNYINRHWMTETNE